MSVFSPLFLASSPPPNGCLFLLRWPGGGTRDRVLPPFRPRGAFASVRESSRPRSLVGAWPCGLAFGRVAFGGVWRRCAVEIGGEGVAWMALCYCELEGSVSCWWRCVVGIGDRSRVASLRVVSCRVTSCRRHVMSCCVVPCPVVLCRAMACSV